MKKILLICDMGMSTSLVVKRMQEAAQAEGIDALIEAKGSQDFDDCAGEFDCYLLAPQISYKLNDFQAVANSHNRPIALINMMDYGMTDGKKILAQAMSMAV
ncbi:PTS system, Lactose/Cellobiose specific IIB subunit [Vibrio ichthyoenteri ATCC 700023]|uniref:PTS system, Lactose/Cellobiose specific IIB subunit n=1 Tax=Vibrio ichthyoenteri ATCC 700023 TaxID=870968 RepID=F9S488_9VIBR|nr:PTS sugar transporter subunit IIB [Vibrio ichthyoenteri]EGU37304.1 PTS system, Lactose/Cellobiose specific IIB subunit [Vibrio ichthyoenteri ATCC 700023]